MVVSNSLKIVIAFVFALPESPRFYYNVGRHEEALQILSDVHGLPKDNPRILAEQREIFEAMSLESLNGEFKWRYVD